MCGCGLEGMGFVVAVVYIGLVVFLGVWGLEFLGIGSLKLGLPLGLHGVLRGTLRCVLAAPGTV